MEDPQVPMEWFLETLDKRVKQGIKLKELFLIVPYFDEAEFEFRIGDYFDKGRRAGNDLEKDYPNLTKALIKTPKVRVFFVRPERQPKPLVLWTKKYYYPKVNKVKGVALMIAEGVVRNVKRRQQKYN